MLMIWPWESFFSHRIHVVYAISYMPLCNGLIYTALTIGVYLLNVEDTVYGRVYTIHVDGTDRLYQTSKNNDQPALLNFRDERKLQLHGYSSLKSVTGTNVFPKIA